MSEGNSIVAAHPACKAALGRAAGFIALLWTACGALPLHASDVHPLTIAIVVMDKDNYVEPADRRVVIRSQSIRLFVRIRNTSDAPLMVRVHPEKAYSLELKDQAGLTSMVTKKKKEKGGEPDDDIRVNLSPGADKIITMDITRDAWEGIPDLKAGKENKYTARVVYETTDGQHVYSEPYTLILSI